MDSYDTFADYADYMGNGKTKRASSLYNRFVRYYMLRGYGMRQIAPMWAKYKAAHNMA